MGIKPVENRAMDTEPSSMSPESKRKARRNGLRKISVRERGNRGQKADGMWARWQNCWRAVRCGMGWGWWKGLDSEVQERWRNDERITKTREKYIRCMACKWAQRKLRTVVSDYYYYKICIAYKFKHARVGGAGVAGLENGQAGESK